MEKIEQLGEIMDTIVGLFFTSLVLLSIQCILMPILFVVGFWLPTETVGLLFDVSVILHLVLIFIVVFCASLFNDMFYHEQRTDHALNKCERIGILSYTTCLGFLIGILPVHLWNNPDVFYVILGILSFGTVCISMFGIGKIWLFEK